MVSDAHGLFSAISLCFGDYACMYRYTTVIHDSSGASWILSQYRTHNWKPLWTSGCEWETEMVNDLLR